MSSNGGEHTWLRLWFRCWWFRFYDGLLLLLEWFDFRFRLGFRFLRFHGNNRPRHWCRNLHHRLLGMQASIAGTTVKENMLIKDCLLQFKSTVASWLTVGALCCLGILLSAVILYTPACWIWWQQATVSSIPFWRKLHHHCTTTTHAEDSEELHNFTA